MPGLQYCHLLPGSNCKWRDRIADDCPLQRQRVQRAAAVARLLTRPLVCVSRSLMVIGRSGFFSTTRSGDFSADQHLALELRQVFLHGVIDAQLALLHAHHQRHGRHGLGHGGDPEHGVRPHRSFVFRSETPTVSSASTFSGDDTMSTAPEIV